MPKATTDWGDVKTWEGIVAAIVASGVKLDLRQVAMYHGVSYDTLENRFRKVKKDAEVLKAQVANGERGEVAPARIKSASTTPRKPKTPKKEPLESVANGRVSKKTPPKKQAIKQEHTISDTSFSFDDPVDSNTPSFNMDDTMFTGDFNVEENDFLV